MIVFVVLAMLRMMVFRPESPSSPAARKTVTVRYVIDGDTFDLTDGRRVRMLGIDAPESGFHGKPTEPYSAESTAWLRDRIEGRQVQLRIDGNQKDRYDRLLAWVFDDKQILINQQMLAEGQAKLLADFGLPLDLEPALRTAESEARIQKLGLWGTSRRSPKKAKR